MGIIYLRGPVLLNRYLAERLDVKTVGIILNIERSMIMHENHMGGEVKIGGFTVVYQYDVAGNMYQKEEYLSRHSLDRNAFLFLVGANSGDSITVRYDSSRPSRARWWKQAD